jgi:HlyD family secretion protein
MIENGLIALSVIAVVACGSEEAPAGYQGVIELDERILGFEVPGRIITVTTVRGDLVAPARVLATLDDAQARGSIAVREAEALAAEQRAKLVAAGGRSEDVRALAAQLRAARVNEQLAVKRSTDDLALVSNGALPRAVADESEARSKAAIAEREVLEQRLRELRVGARTEEITGANAQSSAADAAVKLEADRASRYQLHALEAGEVLDVHVDPGEVVAAGTPVVTIGDTTHPYVDIFVPQQALAGVRVGTRAMVRVDSMTRQLGGVVEHVSRHTEFTPRFIFSPKERANLVVRTRIRVADPQRTLHAGTPAFVTVGG